MTKDTIPIDGETEERIRELEEASEKLEEALGIIERAVRGTSAEDEYRAYTKPHIEQRTSHGRSTQMGSIKSLIETLKEESREEHIQIAIDRAETDEEVEEILEELED